MFILTRLKDTIKVEAWNFGKDRVTALRDELNTRYADKVLPDVGLCMCVFDILDSSEGIVLYGDGRLYHKVVFRMVVFKPLQDEVFIGRLVTSTPEGVKISVNFFDDIWVPAHALPPQSHYDSRKSEWFWTPSDGEDADGRPTYPDPKTVPDEERFYILRNELVRVRTTDLIFRDATPQKPPKAVAAGAAAEAVHAISPFTVLCTMEDSGLGLLDWWAQAAPEPMDEG